MALFYFIAMAALLSSAYCKHTKEAEKLKHLENFARSDTFAVCTMNYFGSNKGSGYGRGGYNSYNSGSNSGNSGSNSGSNGPVGDANVGENVYGNVNTNEVNGDDDDFIQCAQHAWQTYNQNGNNNSNNSGYNPNNSGYNPNNSGYNPNNSGYNPNNSGYNPNNAYNPSYD